jgi:hypothetical protein
MELGSNGQRTFQQPLTHQYEDEGALFIEKYPPRLNEGVLFIAKYPPRKIIKGVFQWKYIPLTIVSKNEVLSLRRNLSV